MTITPFLKAMLTILTEQPKIQSDPARFPVSPAMVVPPKSPTQVFGAHDDRIESDGLKVYPMTIP